MTIKDLLETLDYTSYSQISIRWNPEDPDGDYEEVTSEYANSIVDLFGHIHIPTMAECYKTDGSDAALFINLDKNSNIQITIYLDREDVIRDKT